MSSPHRILVKAAPVRPRSQVALAFTSSGASFTSTLAPSLQPHVSTTEVGTHTARSSATHKRSGKYRPPSVQTLVRKWSFPKPRALLLPVVSFGQAKPLGLGHIDNAESDLMHHQYRLSKMQ